MPRLQVNLASDPFINRVVPLAAMGLLAFLALVLTVTNLTLFAVFGGEYRTLRSKTSKQQARIAKLNAEVQSRKAEISSPSVATFMGEATFLDGVIKAKSFSWSLFLTRLEESKAYGVMLQTVNPQVDKDGRISVSLKGVANPREELLKYENNLFRSNYFRNVTLQREQKDPANPWVQFNITADYDPEGYQPQALPPLPPAEAPAQNAPAQNTPVQPAPVPAGGKAPPPLAPAKAPASPAPGTAPAPAKIPVPPALSPVGAGVPAPSSAANAPPATAPPKPPAGVARPALTPAKGSAAQAGAPGAGVPRGTPAPTKAPPSNPGTPPANRPAASPSGGAP